MSDRRMHFSVLLVVVCSIALSGAAALCGPANIAPSAQETDHHAIHSASPDHSHQAATCPHDAWSPASSLIHVPISPVAASASTLVIDQPIDGPDRLGPGRLLAPVPHLLCVLRT